ncbi:thioredoxin family protein [Salinibacterium sp. TMP30]|uniref:thioredoxin family protein n=1 Tax=Salinibacterium sp. TMP30 TaxID=3138237 RepID=UPI0031390E56
MEITLQYFDGCPNWKVADQHINELVKEFPEITVSRHLVDTIEEAERVGFRGSPSILVDGVDLFAQADEPVGLACRRYLTPDGFAGSPTVEQLREKLHS